MIKDLECTDAKHRKVFHKRCLPHAWPSQRSRTPCVSVYMYQYIPLDEAANFFQMFWKIELDSNNVCRNSIKFTCVVFVYFGGVNIIRKLYSVYIVFKTIFLISAYIPFRWKPLMLEFKRLSCICKENYIKTKGENTHTHTHSSSTGTNDTMMSIIMYFKKLNVKLNVRLCTRWRESILTLIIPYAHFPSH